MQDFYSPIDSGERLSFSRALFPDESDSTTYGLESSRKDISMPSSSRNSGGRSSSSCRGKTNRNSDGGMAESR